MHWHLGFVAALAVAGCSRSSAPPAAKTIAIDPETAATYLRMCAPCHGVDARGYAADHAPSLVTSTFLESASDEFLKRSIVYGRPGTAMAAYGKAMGGPLDDASITKLVAWLRAHGPAPKVLAAAPNTGDPTRGAPLYAQHCQKCHGDRDTRGEGIHLANPKFLSLATNAFIRYAIVNGRPGTQMLPFGSNGSAVGSTAGTGARPAALPNGRAVGSTAGTGARPAALPNGRAVGSTAGTGARPAALPNGSAVGSTLSAENIDDLVAFIRKFAVTKEVGSLPPPTGTEPLELNPKGPPAVFELKEDRYVSAEQVANAMAQQARLVIIDARPASDWMRVHITGAVSIPHLDMKRLDELTNDGTWIVAYCACPHHLSGIVVDELRKRGFKHAVVLDEGILEWHRRGYPVVAAPGVEPPPRELPPLPPPALRP